MLTGVLLALAANGLEMEDVACIGVFAHGMARGFVAGGARDAGDDCGVVGGGDGKGLE